jgi:hypothetical protein
MQTEVLPPCVKRWSADEYPYPSSPSPKRAEPVRPEHQRGRIVAEDVRGHVVGSAAVQSSDTGRRYSALVPGDLRPGDCVAFDVIQDPTSQLQIARLVRPLSE